MLRCDVLMAIIDAPAPAPVGARARPPAGGVPAAAPRAAAANLSEWDPAHTLVACLDLCCRRGEADRKLLRQVLSYLAAQGLPPVADLPSLMPPKPPKEPPRKKQRGGRGGRGAAAAEAAAAAAAAAAVTLDEAELRAQRSRLADAAMVLAAWPVAQQLARTVMQRLEALVDAGAQPPAGESGPSSPAYEPPEGGDDAPPPPPPPPPPPAGLPVDDAELCALAQLLLLPTHAVSLLGSGRLAPEKWEMEVLRLLCRRLPLLAMLLADDRLHALGVEAAEKGSGPPPPLPPPPQSLRKVVRKDPAMMRLALLYTLQRVAAGPRQEARAAQMLHLLGEAAVPLDSQIDSIRSLVSLVVGRPALLTPALSGALLLGFLLPAATRSHAVHSRLLVLLEKCAQHFRYAQPTSVLASLDRSASAEGRRRSLLAEALCRARDEGQRGDEADYFEREYARLALVLPELASEQG